MLVSIIIPCYNHSQYLYECLQSILAQTYKNWEAIVIDDASTRGDAGQILNNLADPRIKLVRHQENLGLSASRNTGIRNSKGQLVLPLDADDKLAPKYLEKIAAFLVEHPEYDCVFTDLYNFGIREKIVRYQVQDPHTLLLQQWLPGAGTTFKKSLWKKVGGYCEAQELRAGNEDWDFYLGAAEIGFSAGHISEPLYYYRKHRESMVTRLGYVDYQTRIFMYYRHQKLFNYFDLGDRFIADGYRNSINMSLQNGELLRAVNLVIEASRFRTKHRFGIVKSMMKEVATAFISHIIRKTYRLGRYFKRKILTIVRKPRLLKEK